MDFENFYITWYSRVKHFARDYVLSEEEAENITQDVFLDFYQKRDSLDFHINVIAYLFTSVKNRCIDYLRRKLLEQEAAAKMQEEFDLSFRMKFDSLEAFNLEGLSEDNIKNIIEKALESLPERCREIFVMSKIEGKKQKEIAEELGVSVKTIECQMTIAYKKLREELKNYLPLLLFLLSS
ncbi:RNA polymerase sigma-70 factor [Parabacteroides gordonii]|uniref:RNA polymerase sigma-70 factor n=1 Tax=Parabacteroides gordonii MS-1 = DSM 23371 TaxID=1203610 RepID=A0A0F5JDZ5_9BACT|nr:RNA polymerase sigma-70 factor [Parabacteroides gordonii]KKB55672.1 RNA polymerase sigma-70 factor [Parabacteroides gordonii MS-1 = DSM 23371]MCA5581543.1 RNA polymerase sigma-70 factor [Parabacteroides gordonii]